jgi:hypothetical protein
MRIGQAATYFCRTIFDGWNGTAWVDNVVTAALQGYDRSLMVGNPFDTKLRYLLANPAASLSSTYTVIRPHNDPTTKYMVGDMQKDTEDTVYSHVYLIHQVTVDVGLYLNATTVKASGVPAGFTSTLQKTIPGDIEKVSEVAKEKLQGLTHGAYAAVLPAGTVVNRNYDLKINGVTYVVNECFPAAGLIRCNIREKDVP